MNQSVTKIITIKEWAILCNNADKNDNNIYVTIKLFDIDGEEIILSLAVVLPHKFDLA